MIPTWIQLFLCLVFQFLHSSDGATWADFQQRHVLDPAGNAGYLNWNSQSWNQLLQARLGPRQYGVKAFNTFVVAGPGDILTDFSGVSTKYVSARCGTNCFWSKTARPVYIATLVRRNGSYSIKKCPPKYIVAGVNIGQPVHFHGQNDAVVSGNLNNGQSGCVSVL